MNKVTIISGKKHSGKTTKLLSYISELQSKNLICAGIVAVGRYKDDKRCSFELIDILGNKKHEFLTTTPSLKFKKIGRFHIIPDGEKFGRNVLENETTLNADVIIIDEIGPMELDGKGWAKYLKQFLKLDINLVITVREELLEEVCKEFGINNYLRLYTS